MTKRKLVLTVAGVMILAAVIIIAYAYFSRPVEDKKKESQQTNDAENKLENVTSGNEEYRGFLLDNVLHSEREGDIHYNVYIPDSYDGTKEYALYVTLPGYQGLYFQGVGENIRTEDFGFEAQNYNSEMIIVALQLDDWGQTSAEQTIELTQYFQEHYKIDPAKVYISMEADICSAVIRKLWDGCSAIKFWIAMRSEEAASGRLWRYNRRVNTRKLIETSPGTILEI